MVTETLARSAMSSNGRTLALALAEEAKRFDGQPRRRGFEPPFWGTISFSSPWARLVAASSVSSSLIRRRDFASSVCARAPHQDQARDYGS